MEGKNSRVRVVKNSEDVVSPLSAIPNRLRDEVSRSWSFTIKFGLVLVVSSSYCEFSWSVPGYRKWSGCRLEDPKGVGVN